MRMRRYRRGGLPRALVQYGPSGPLVRQGLQSSRLPSPVRSAGPSDGRRRPDRLREEDASKASSRDASHAHTGHHINHGPVGPETGGSAADILRRQRQLDRGTRNGPSGTDSSPRRSQGPLEPTTRSLTHSRCLARSTLSVGRLFGSGRSRTFADGGLQWGVGGERAGASAALQLVRGLSSSEVRRPGCC